MSPAETPGGGSRGVCTDMARARAGRCVWMKLLALTGSFWQMLECCRAPDCPMRAARLPMPEVQNHLEALRQALYICCCNCSLLEHFVGSSEYARL